MPEGTGDKGLQELKARLELQLEKERKSNKSLGMVAVGFVVVVGGYLLWLSWALGTMVDPANLAEATAGMAIDAAPGLTQHLRTVVVDGAPDLARTASSAAVDMIPSYRTTLEDEMKPVVDEVAEVIAETAVKEMVASGEAKMDGQTMQAASEAAVARLAEVLDEAMDEPITEDADGRTPRQMIEGSLTHLTTIDRGLKRMAKGGGDKSERELVMAWLNLVQQYNDSADAAAAQDYREGKVTP
ncbi:MAG: hypothetical protein ABIO70_26255 [Pseudomonadota bacterium]